MTDLAIPRMRQKAQNKANTTHGLRVVFLAPGSQV